MASIHELTDEIFRYVFDAKHCLTTDIEYHLHKHFPKHGYNIRPLIKELENAGLVYTEAGFTYISIYPKGERIAAEFGLYSIYLENQKKEVLKESKISIEGGIHHSVVGYSSKDSSFEAVNSPIINDKPQSKPAIMAMSKLLVKIAIAVISTILGGLIVWYLTK